MDKKTQRIIAANLEALRLARGIPSWNSLGEKAKVSPGMIGRILKLTNSPTLEILDRLADYFGMPTWCLMVEGLPAQELLSQKPAHLLANYADASEDGKAAVQQIAATEARYARIQAELPEAAPQFRPPRPAAASSTMQARPTRQRSHSEE